MSSTTKRHWGFAWHQTLRVIGGRSSSVLYLHCASCTNKIEQTKAGHLNPHHVKKWFERKGWQLNGHDTRSVKCPNCIAADKPKPAPKLVLVETPLHEKDLTREAIRGWRDHQTNKGKGSAPQPTHPAKPEQSRDAHPVITKPEGNMNNMTPAAPPALTTDQKAQARDFLDRHFNPDIGQYAAHFSDEVIARQIKPAVPYASIAAFRELAYGELKGDPELNAIREALAQQRKELDAVVERAGRLETSIATTEKKLADVVARKFKP